jgi:hypothetical protein
MSEPSREFQLAQLTEVLVREGKARLRMMVLVGEYAHLSAEDAHGRCTEEVLRAKLSEIEDGIQTLCEAAREAGAMAGQAT